VTTHDDVRDAELLDGILDGRGLGAIADGVAALVGARHDVADVADSE
jgi:hypothetical protein